MNVADIFLNYISLSGCCFYVHTWGDIGINILYWLWLWSRVLFSLYWVYTGCSKKTDTQFYFWDNFGNSAPILTILSLLQAEIYGA